MSRISEIFSNKKPVITYITAGDPSLGVTRKLYFNIIKAGADIVELGIPFSDSLADGPVIQNSHLRALRSGTHLKRVLDMVKKIRKKSQTPIIFMISANLILAYGIKAFFIDLKENGVDGVIIPDLPPDEAKDFAALSLDNQIDIIFLASTLSSDERLELIAANSTSFIYLISSTGVTGTKRSLPLEEIQNTISRIRRFTKIPVAVGFGVSNPEQARAVLDIADGVIIGSAIVSAAQRSIGRAKQLVRKIVKRAVEK